MKFKVGDEIIANGDQSRGTIIDIRNEKYVVEWTFENGRKLINLYPIQYFTEDSTSWRIATKLEKALS